MIKPLTSDERALWNLDQPSARVTADLQAENGPRELMRYWAILDRFVAAEWWAKRKAIP